MEDQFRKMLEYFYVKASNLSNKDIYFQVLQDHLDNIPIEPVHYIATKADPHFPITFKHKKTAPIKQKQYLYKNTNFPSAFLFAFFLHCLKNENLPFIKNLHGITLNALFQEEKKIKQVDNQLKILQIDKIFQFLYRIKEKNYNSDQILVPLFKKFFKSVFERKGLKPADKQKYPSESQLILPYILSKNKKLISQEQICEPKSQAYQNNQLNFTIILLDINSNEEWIIGEGKNQIQIFKNKKQFMIQKTYEEPINSEEDQIQQSWNEILEDSIDLGKQYEKNSMLLISNLNLTFEKSPTQKRGPKSVTYQPIHAKKYKNLFIS